MALRRFYAWLVITEQASHDPTVHLRAPRITPGEIPVYPPDQIGQILGHTGSLTHLRGRIRHTIVATLRFIGMRSGELRTLRRDRLDLQAEQALVIGKGLRPRIVVIPPPLRPILWAFLDEVRPELPDSPLLLSNPSSRVTTPLIGFSHEALYREVELAGRGADVPGRHFPHRWRHTFATELSCTVGSTSTWCSGCSGTRASPRRSAPATLPSMTCRTPSPGCSRTTSGGRWLVQGGVGPAAAPLEVGL